ncbi:hypothetical protein MD537_15785, partial [Flavihumibacter sediminis]|nr:hypothetical protein [Flavihumibacter sediminis]
MDTKFNLIDALTPKLCGKPVRSISTCFTLLIMLCLLNIPGATGQTIDFKQAQNDLNGAKTFDIEWTNGILNATHTQYYEGFGIPQRLMFTNLAGGTYTLRFKFQAGFSKGGNNGTHAYDFLMSHEQAIAVAENIGGTVNELSKLLTQGCSDNIAPCATLAAIAAPDTRIVRLQAPDMPALYLGDNVQDEIDCFESIYGDREIEIRGNAAITDADIEFDGYTDDFAYFTVTWTSTSSQIMVRYASRAAVGEGEYCGDPLAQSGYGAGKGAGSISGGNFHNIFVSLNGEGQEILGERDNQLMAGAIEIAPPPPPCGFDGPRRACPETGSLAYTVPNAIRAAGATYAWTIIPGNPSAGAVIENGTGTPPLTKSGVDLYSINVIPAGTDFIAGGTFQVRLDVTRFGLTTTCYLSGEGENGGVVSIVNIDATANPESPAEIDLNSASPTSQLGVTVWPGVVGDYTFLWSQDPPSGGSLSANNIYNPVFTATETGDYTFTVQATDEGLTCASSVIVRVTSSSPTCPEISGTATTCANTTGLVFSVTADPPANFSYSWSVNNGASIQGSAPHTGKSITVDAGASSFTVTLNMVPDNPSQPTIPCTYEVTVNPIPTCSIAGDDEVCSGSTGNVYTSTVLPAGGTVTHSWSISGNGTITSATNLASVTVTAGAAGSFTLRDDITRDGCPSYCEYTVTVDPIPTCSIAGDDEVCSGSTGNVYTSTVLPAGGTVTHSWSISGNGTITSATNLASVTVTAGA